MAKTLNFVGIAISAKHQTKRRSAATRLSTVDDAFVFRMAARAGLGRSGDPLGLVTSPRKADVAEG
jgi:hypothetical protein